MNLDILRTEWATRDEKLDALLRINNRYLREGFLERKRAEVMKRLPFGPLSIALWAVWLGLLALFIATHLGEPKFLVPAIALQAWAIWTGGSAIQQRLAMQAVDYSRPMVEVQRALEAIRIDRLRTFKWAMLTGQVVWWFPFFIVFFKGLFGADLYRNAFLSDLMLRGVIIGIAAIPVILLVARELRKRFPASKRLRKIGDALAGEDLAHAHEFLAKLERFERE